MLTWSVLAVLVHHLEDLDPTAFGAGIFDKIDSQRFRLIKSRFLVVTDALQHQPHHVSQVILNELDKAIISGETSFNNVMADLLQMFSSQPLSDSFMGRVKRGFRHLFRVGHSTVKQLVDRKASVEDVDFLNNHLFGNNWHSRMPRSFFELQRFVTGWLRDKIESQTLAIAWAISDAQSHSVQEVAKTTINVHFEDRKKEQLEVFKQEINQAETDRQTR